MKSLLKILFYPFIFLFSIIVFFPKEYAYNFLEKELKKEEVIISDERRNENIFSLKITDGILYVKGIKLANINKAQINTYLFYNTIEVRNIEFLDNLKNILPSPVSSAKLTYSILEFDKVVINANGVFGKLEGYVDLMSKKVILTLEASSKMKKSYTKILNMMSFKNGRYSYEYKL